MITNSKVWTCITHVQSKPPPHTHTTDVSWGFQVFVHPSFCFLLCHQADEWQSLPLPGPNVVLGENNLHSALIQVVILSLFYFITYLLRCILLSISLAVLYHYRERCASKRCGNIAEVNGVFPRHRMPLRYPMQIMSGACESPVPCGES